MQSKPKILGKKEAQGAFPSVKGEQDSQRVFGAPLSGWMGGMPEGRSETREGLDCSLPSGREWEWRWKRGWDRQVLHRHPGCHRDLDFAIKHLGEGGGTGIPFPV